MVPFHVSAFLHAVASIHDGDGRGNVTYSPANPAELVNVTAIRTHRQLAWAGSFEGATPIE